MEKEVKYKIKRTIYYFPTRKIFNRNTILNHDSISTPYLSLSPSSRIIETLNLPSKYNIKKQYKILTRNLNNIKKAKSNLLYLNKTEYGNFHRKILKKKIKTNSNIGNSHFFITLSQENNTLSDLNNNIKTYSNPPELNEKYKKRQFFNLTKKINNNQPLTPREFSNEIKDFFKKRIISNVLKKKKRNYIEDYNNKSERIDMKIFQLKIGNNLIDSFIQSNKDLLRFSRNEKEKEENKLDDIIIQKELLIDEIKKLSEDIEKKQNILKFYKSIEDINKQFFGNTIEFIENPNFIEEKINEWTNINIKLLNILNDKKNSLFRIKKKLNNLEIEINKDSIFDEKIKIKKNHLNDLKMKYFLLLKKKEYYLKENKKCNREDKKIIYNFNTLNMKRMLKINREIKYNNMIYNSIPYSTLAKVLSDMIKNIRNYSPNFYIIPKKMRNYEVEYILNLKYNEKNKKEINKNILIMILILERSWESLFIELKKDVLIPTNANFIKNELYTIDKNKQKENIKNYNIISNEIREKMIENIIKKDNKIILKPKKKINKYHSQTNLFKKISNKKNQQSKPIMDYTNIIEGI
jgi:hypothetical protein